MRVSRLEEMVTTVLWTGYSPAAPATVASAVVCAALWFAPKLLEVWMIGPLALLTLIGVWLSNRYIANQAEVSVPQIIDALSKRFKALRRKNPKPADPDAVVFDELVGQWITLLAAPHSLAGFTAGFLLFRFFDIFKVLGANQLQKLPNGWGVMLDDVLAGAYAALVLFAMNAWQPKLLSAF